jgi:hypothetical protein
MIAVMQVEETHDQQADKQQAKNQGHGALSD